MTERRKKLIEVSIPLEAINKADAEKSINLHLWWARRPRSACRAVLFAQMVDDPSSWPEHFPTEEDQKQERERLHKIIEEMMPQKASTSLNILNKARYEIARSVAWGLGEEPPVKTDPDAVFAYLQEKAPPVYDPFSGSGSIPLEAQRLGLRSYGSDINPVAVLISKSVVEIPPKFAGRLPANPGHDAHRTWKGAEGLADDVRYYGEWMRDEAEKRIGNLYPKIKLEDGADATVIAWLWARTVASPDPAAKGAHVPLVSSFMISSKKGKKAWVEVVLDSNAQNGWRFEVKTGNLSADKEKKLKEGTKGRGSAQFVCTLTSAPIDSNYVRSESKSGHMDCRLMAIAAKGDKRRIYVNPTAEHEDAAKINTPENLPEGELFEKALGFRVPNYGYKKWHQLFTSRQLQVLTTFSDLVMEMREQVLSDAQKSNLAPDTTSLANGGSGITAYADAIATFLSFAIDKLADAGNSFVRWRADNQCSTQLFGRQAIPMVWDYAEANPFSTNSGSFSVAYESQSKVMESCYGWCTQRAISHINNIEAQNNTYPAYPCVISTDPPYYDNIGYADLSDFFYVWLRRSLKSVWPDLFRRLLTPKEAELVATPGRHGGKAGAEFFFLGGMSQTLNAMHSVVEPNVPITIYYAFKQSEIAQEGLTSAGWASFLQAIQNAGYIIDGTWPLRTEKKGRMRAIGSNALASSIVLVCTKRPSDAPVVTQREFFARLKSEMPNALQKIKEAGVGPVDMAQSALGPGMGIFTSCAKVLEPDDSEMTVRTAIALINRVREEIMGEEDAGYDTPTRFCIDWFQAFGMAPGQSGDAINMANAYNLSIDELERLGVLYAKAGVTRLLQRSEMPEDWTPDADKTLTHWECAQHVIRVLESEDGGGDAAAKLIAAMRPEDAAAARALAYRLYDICEKKGWAQEAQAYNLLAGEFPHLESKALEFQDSVGPAQGGLDLGG